MSSPVQLTAEPAAGGVQFKVIATSADAYEAVFSLEIHGNGNRSVHRGSVNLQPGESALLSSVTMANLTAGSWSARLLVEPLGAESYEQILPSQSE